MTQDELVAQKLSGLIHPMDQARLYLDPELRIDGQMRLDALEALTREIHQVLSELFADLGGSDDAGSQETH